MGGGTSIHGTSICWEFVRNAKLLSPRLDLVKQHLCWGGGLLQPEAKAPPTPMCWGHTTTFIPAEGGTWTYILVTHLQALSLLPPETQHSLPSAPARLKKTGQPTFGRCKSHVLCPGQKAKKCPQETPCSQAWRLLPPPQDTATESLPPGNTVPGTLTEGFGGFLKEYFDHKNVHLLPQPQNLIPR